MSGRQNKIPIQDLERNRLKWCFKNDVMRRSVTVHWPFCVAVFFTCVLCGKKTLNHPVIANAYFDAICCFRFILFVALKVFFLLCQSLSEN